jgi:hypothetical protein
MHFALHTPITDMVLCINAHTQGGQLLTFVHQFVLHVLIVHLKVLQYILLNQRLGNALLSLSFPNGRSYKLTIIMMVGINIIVMRI